MSQLLARKGVEYLSEQFLRLMEPVLLEQGFARSPFSSHNFGRCNDGFRYSFISLQDDVLETLYFDIFRARMKISPNFNRFRLASDHSSFEDFSKLSGLNIMTMPLRSTEEEIMPIGRYFLISIPKPYWIPKSSMRDEANIFSAIDKLIERLSGDFQDFGRHRGDWKKKHTPRLLHLEDLE